MRVAPLAATLVLAASLTSCQRHPMFPSDKAAGLAGQRNEARLDRPAESATAAAPGGAPVATSDEETAGRLPSLGPDAAFEPGTNLIIRTGQAGIEVDSLGTALSSLRTIAGRAGGFLGAANVQTGRDQMRQATVEIKVPAARFDELAEGLRPLGRLEYLTVSAEDVSEEFVDLTARTANARRLEERLIDLLATRTGKLQDVLTVERELARVREEIERMEGRLRFLQARARLSTLSVTLHEPPPLVAVRPGLNPLGEAARQAWRNFVGVLAGAIASLGYVVPVLVLGWGAAVLIRRGARRPA
jgi:hypothetical protein